jgi:hypothetical protein
VNPDIKLPAVPELITPPDQPPPPQQPSVQAPPPATITPAVPNVPAIISPAPGAPPPPAPPSSEAAPPSTPAPSENPPTQVAPNLNVPGLLKGLQQRRNAPTQDGETEEDDTETVPETPLQTAPQTLPTVPNLKLQMQAPAPVQQ